MEVFYLNLGKRTDRDQRFLRANAAWIVPRRQEAVDGSKLRSEDLMREGVIAEPLRDYNPGALGCAVGHKNLWEMCVAKGTTLTVAEDDAVVNHAFADKATDVLSRLPADWEFILWGWNFDSVLYTEIMGGVNGAVMHFDLGQLGEGITRFQNEDYDVLPLRLIAAFGTICYSVSPQGAARLLQICFPLRNEVVAVPGLRRELPNNGIDLVLIKSYPKLNAFVAFPPLVWTENDKALSDIAPGRRQAGSGNAEADAKVTRGTALALKGRRAEAMALFREALQLQPDHAKAHHNLGVALAEEKNLTDALAAFREALVWQPQYPEAHHSLGNTLAEMGRDEEAVLAFREAIRIKPDLADAHHNLGVTLTRLGRAGEAIVYLEHAVRLRPNAADGHNNLGLAYAERGDYQAAEACYRRALQLNPHFADAHTNLGSAFKEQGRLEDAIASYDLALVLEPDQASTRWNRALAWLQMGNYRQGWQEYEWRWRRRGATPREFNQPLWNGDDLNGQTILLHCEQGLGDDVQFIRYAALVKKRGGTVCVAAPPSLVELFGSCPGVDRVVPEDQPLPPFDVHAPLMSLPGVFATTLETVPAVVPYLSADPARVERWRQRSRTIPGRKVGVVWQGNPRHKWDRHRSFSLARLESLSRLDDVSLVSLQLGVSEAQLSGKKILCLGPEITDFADTAAILHCLDLVICCDTSLAHLAGAMAIPVWVAVATIADWRWLRERDDSPWYPTLRLFRQQQQGDWQNVFCRIARELRELSRPQKEST